MSRPQTALSTSSTPCSSRPPESVARRTPAGGPAPASGAAAHATGHRAWAPGSTPIATAAYRHPAEHRQCEPLDCTEPTDCYSGSAGGVPHMATHARATGRDETEDRSAGTPGAGRHSIARSRQGWGEWSFVEGSTRGESARFRVDTPIRAVRATVRFPSADDGVQSGVQTERNSPELRSTRRHAGTPNGASYAWIRPAGGRAVAGSNPVSPMRSSCKS
jgi:hypothetical protein